MESYVVRVYRRDAKDSEKLAGLVELTDREEEKPFVSFAELWKILSSPGQDAQGAVTCLPNSTEGDEKTRR
jgi:hypothetical protein